jgi:hypothetical protein
MNRKVSEEMWQQINRVLAHADLDAQFSRRDAVIRVGAANGFTEQDLIDSHVLHPNKQSQKRFEKEEREASHIHEGRRRR